MSVVYIPAAAIANPYVAALSMGIIIAIRGTIGREPIVASRLILPIALCIAWPVYSLMLLPIGQSPIRWISEIGQLVLGLAVLLFYSSSVIDRRDLALVAKGIIAAALILSVVAVARSFFGISLAQSGPLGPVAYNYSSITMLVAITCLVSRVDQYSDDENASKYGVSRIAAGLILGVGVYCNESRAALLMALVVVALQFIFGAKRTLAGYAGRSMAVLLFVGLSGVLLGSALGITQMLTSLFDFSGYNFSNLERLALLLNSYELFMANPLGYGIGSSSELFSNTPFTEGAYPHPHNTLAMFAVELGVVGIVLYLTLSVSLLFLGYRGFKSISMDPRLGSFCMLASVAILSSTLYTALFFNGALALSVFSFLGLIWAGTNVLSETSSLAQRVFAGKRP